MSSQRLLIRNGFVVSMDPDVGDIPNGDVLVEDGKIVEIGRGLEASGRGADRRDRDDRDAGIRRHAPAHVADAGSRRAPVLHARPLLRGHARQRRRPLPPGGRPHRQLRRRARGAQRRRDDAARLVAHQQHARPLRRGDPGPEGRRHPRGLRARRADRRRVVGVQRARPSGGHPPHPRHVLLVRRRPDHARTGGARAGQLELRGREARLGARARPRRSASACTSACGFTDLHVHHGEGHARPRADGPRHDVHPLHRLDRRGARPDRGDGRNGRRSRRTSRC